MLSATITDSLRRDADRQGQALAEAARTLARLIREGATVEGTRDALDRLRQVQRHLQVTYGSAILLRPVTAAPRQPDAFDDLGFRLHLLDQLLAQLATAQAAAPQPLYPADPAPGDPLAEQARLSDRVFNALHRLLSPVSQDNAAHAAGAFPDIPMPGGRFLAHAHAALRCARAQNRADRLRFLDVGCGIGLTVLMAAELFDEAWGLDLDPGYVRAARALTRRAGLKGSRILRADAIAFADYGKADVIYVYQPIRDRDLLEQMERHLVATARPGTILVAPYVGFAARAEGLGCPHVAGAVYLSSGTPAEAALLRAAAERVGTLIYHPQTPLDRRTGSLTGLAEAMRAMGIGG